MPETPMHATPAPAPELLLTVLLELDAQGRCTRALDSLERQSVPRNCYEIIGVHAGAPLPAALCRRVDWVLTEPSAGPGSVTRTLNRATHMATGRIVALCDAQAEFPPGFVECLAASFGSEGSRARQPVVTLRAAATQAAEPSKQALAFYRQDAQLVLAAGRPTMPLEDVAWLLVESGAQHLRLDISAEPALAPTLDWRDVPVFIVNRNRHAALERLVTWLIGGGTRKVVILDNDSSYPPLLAYYDHLPAGASVLKLGENHGPYVLFEQGVHQVLDTPYVLTDSDIVPAEFCPSDLIGRLLEVLRKYPDASKVGPALRIDNLPDGYADADTVRKWESQFWEHPIAPGVFAAPIDTTFALYPPKAEFSIDDRALRLGYPYIAEHTPWYALETALSDEERYYRAHASKTFSNWSVRGKQSSTYMSERVRAFDRRAKVLNVDGAGEYIPGWINAGYGDRPVDIVFDPARCASTPLTLADGCIDGIRLHHALAEVDDVDALLAELRRVARPGAKLQVRMPCDTRHTSTAEWQQLAWVQRLTAAAARCHWDIQEIRLVTDPAAVARRLQQRDSSRGNGASGVHAVVVSLEALEALEAQRTGAGPNPIPRPVVIADDRLAPHFTTARRPAAVRPAATLAAA